MGTTHLSVVAALLLIPFLHDDEARTAEPARQGGQRLLEDVFDEVRSSVVTVYVAEAVSQPDAQGNVQVVQSHGSGVLLGDGRVLTAAHVVHSADDVVVEYLDGTSASARVIGSVVQGDVALLQVDDAPPAGVRAAVLGDSDKVRVGSECFVIGAPRGLTHTLTTGRISARRSWEGPKKMLVKPDLFQTDAAINTGNSGGPMFDLQGQVIGIMSFIKSRTKDSAGLGFAVTSNTARRLLLERNSIWSGMTEVFLTGALARAFHLPEGRSGFLLQHVSRNSPAARLGLIGGSIPATINGESFLLGGDVLLEAFGRRLDSTELALAIMNSLPDIKPTTPVHVVVYRDGKLVTLEAAAGDLAPWLK